MNRRLTIGLLIALVLTHIGLAIGFASVTPYRTPGQIIGSGGPPTPIGDVGAPDERQHVNYARDLAQGKGFQVFNPQDPNLYETYQRHQPPVFYLLEAGWSKVVGVSDFDSSTAGIQMRSLNALIGGTTVVGVFFLGFWGFRSEAVGLVGAAFAGLLPMFVALSGAVSNDPLLICLCTWTLALVGLSVNDGWTWKRAITIGLLTGLALLTKTTALALVPILLLAAFIKQPTRPSPKMVAATAFLALILVGPWWVRNQSLYHDPLALKAFASAFTQSAQKEGIQSIIKAQDPEAQPELSYWTNWVGWWTARSFFGVFGYMDIFLNEHGVSATGARSPNTLYRLLLAGTFLCAVGWILSFKQEDAKARGPMNLINGAFFLVILLLFLKFNNQYFQAQARYLLPAIGPIACAIAIGLLALLKNRTYAALGIVAAALLGLNLYALSQLPDEFRKRTNGAFGTSMSNPGVRSPIMSHDEVVLC